MKRIIRRLVVSLVLCLSLMSIGQVAMALDKIDLNQATVEQLMTLKGVGEKTALSIIEYRDSHKGFSRLDELGNVKGIGDKKLEALRDFLVVVDKEKS